MSMRRIPINREIQIEFDLQDSSQYFFIIEKLPFEKALTEKVHP